MMASRIVPLGATSFLKASLKNPVWSSSFVVPAVRSWRSSSLCLCVPSFYSLGSVLQLLTLPSSSCLSNGCFVVVVVGLLSGIWCRECHGRSPLWILCHRGSLFPRRMLCRRRNSWRMLCRHWLLGPLSGRCFVAESVWTLFLADAWPPWSLGLRWRRLCRCCCWMLLYLIRVDALPP